MLQLMRGLLASIAAVLVGWLAGLGVVDPKAALAIPILGAGGYVFIALTSPQTALAALLFAAPLAQFVRLDIPLPGGLPDLTLIRLSTSFLFVLFLGKISVGEGQWPKIRGIDVAFLLAVVGIGLSLTKSIEPARSSQVFLDSYVVPLLAYFLARDLIRERLWFDRIASVLVIVGIYLSVLIIHEQLTGQGIFVPPTAESAITRYSENLSRTVVIFGNSAFSGTFLAIVFPITLILLMRASSSRAKLFLILALAVNGAGLFFTYTRAAWITTMLALLVIQFFFPRFRRILLPILGLGVITVLIFGESFASNPLYSERIVRGASLEGRLSLIPLALEFTAANPILGIGFDNFRHVTLDSRLTDIVNTHNSLLFILVSSGLAGLLPYLTGIFFAWKETIASTRWLAARGEGYLMAPILVALIAYLGNALAIDMMSAPYLNLVFFVMIGGHLGLLESLKSEERVREEELSWERTSPLHASV